jgi:MarR family transcriptional regulator, organic hydroperoxide resistance regulator
MKKKSDSIKEFLEVLKEPEEYPGFMLWQASNIWQRIMKSDLKEFNATYTQWIILCSLIYLSKQYPDINQRLIARHAKLDIMTVSDVLKTLEIKKLIVRAVNLEDRRHNSLKITEKGARLVYLIFNKVLKSDGMFFKALGIDQEKFTELLSKLIRGNYDNIYNARE